MSSSIFQALILVHCRCCDKPECRHKSLDNNGRCKNLNCHTRPTSKCVWGDLKIAILNLRTAQITSHRIWLQRLEDLHSDLFNEPLPDLAIPANLERMMQRFKEKFALSQPPVNVRYNLTGETINTIMVD